VIQNVYPDQSLGQSSTQLVLQTNGINNPNQNLLNLVGGGNISITINSLGQTVLYSTGVAIPATGTAPLLSSALATVTTAPSGDILVADGLGNVQDSGVLYSSLATAASVAAITTNTTLSGTTNIQLANITSMNGVLNAADFAGVDIGVKANAAILSLAGAGGTVYIPAGTYNYSFTIVKPRNVNLIGAGAGATILNWVPTTGWAIVVADNAASLFYLEGEIADLSITGPGSGTATGGLYVGGSDGLVFNGVSSPTVATIPGSWAGDHQNFNRIRIFDGFGVGWQLGLNAWSITTFESLMSNNGYGIYVAGQTGSTTGERITFIGCVIQNNTVGIQSKDSNQTDVHCIACSFDNNSSWAVKVGTVGSNQMFCLTDCHIEQASNFLQNFGFTNVVNTTFLSGINSGVLGWLIDNETSGGLIITGGTFFNNGSGQINKPSGFVSTWIGTVSATSINNANLFDRFGNIVVAGLMSAPELVANSLNPGGTLVLQGLVGSASAIAAMYGCGVTPSTTNFCFAVSSASTYMNAPTSIFMQIAATTAFEVTSTGVIIAGATPTGALTGIGLGSTTSATATAGGATLPVAPVGFLEVNIGGTIRKIPYYAA
jgi:hypothetical protein